MTLSNYQTDKSVTCNSLLEQAGITKLLAGDVTEIAINRPHEILTEAAHGWESHRSDIMSYDFLSKLVNAIAVFNGQKINHQTPILSMVLPSGERVQCVIPPACENGKISVTIRKPSNKRFSLKDYVDSCRLSNFYDAAFYKENSEKLEIKEFEQQMLEAKNSRDMLNFFNLAIKNKLNIVLVGATGSGKTTATKALIDLVPFDTRIVTIEDTPELDLPNHINSVRLFYGTHTTPKQVVASCMRMKPDRVFLTELRGDETWDYISLLNTGHPGSITTVHANDCQSAFNRIATLVKQSPIGQSLDLDFILREVHLTIDVVAFFKKTYMTELYYDPIHKLKLKI
jgi:type IV secretion system protein VirB11